MIFDTWYDLGYMLWQSLNAFICNYDFVDARGRLTKQHVRQKETQKPCTAKHFCFNAPNQSGWSACGHDAMFGPHGDLTQKTNHVLQHWHVVEVTWLKLPGTTTNYSIRYWEVMGVWCCSDIIWSCSRMLCWGESYVPDKDLIWNLPRQRLSITCNG